MEIITYPLKSTLIGAPIELPEHVRKARAMHSLTHEYWSGRPFNDKYCFFRAYALHTGTAATALENRKKALVSDLEKHTKRSFKNGVDLDSLAAIEIYFKVSVNVYSLGEDGRAELIRISKLNYDVMHLNLYQDHFSYIKNIRKYAKQFQCIVCERILNRSGNLRAHLKIYSVEREEVYV